jgi:glycosyltransferase involved in cell wall biosynthesis
MRILYIGACHRINDPRLLHREMKLLRNTLDDVEFWFLDFAWQPQRVDRSENRICISANEETVSGRPVNHMIIQSDLPPIRSLVGQSRHHVHLHIAQAIEEYFNGKHVDFIQASDVREIKITLQLGKRLGSKLIYDSHEDYIRQALDYRKGFLRRYIWASIFLYREMRDIRSFDHVFCTDEFLFERYSRSVYSAKSVKLLRNYPRISSIYCHKREYRDKNLLRLVYIGGVNEHRGVIEVAKYVTQFNSHWDNKQLELTVYGPDNQLIRDLVRKYGIIHIGWIDYAELMATLDHYDVGICLWLPIKKFHRNLPLKNFDYMSQGLPIVTSNFGNLVKYVRLSGAGVCIDPTSYDEFENAIAPMFEGVYRKQFGESGVNWVRHTGNFEIEGQEYVSVFRQ